MLMKNAGLCLLAIAWLIGCTTPLDSAHAEPSDDPLDRFVSRMFEMHGGTTLCVSEQDSRSDYPEMVAMTLLARGVAHPSPEQVAVTMWTLFPCPFRPDRHYVRAVRASEVPGVWVFPQRSQHLRFGPQSESRSPTFPLETVCEVLGFYEQGEFRRMLAGGKHDCPVENVGDFEAVRALPRTSSWTIDGHGRLNIARSDVVGHIEQWGMYLVEQPFTANGVDFEAGDIISYLRKDRYNTNTNAATQFRHLVRLPAGGSRARNERYK